MSRRLLGAVVLGFLAVPVSGAVPVVDRPIAFGPKRRALTLEYVRRHYDPGAESLGIVPRMVVVHWSGSATARSVFAAFEPEELPSGRPELERGGRLNVSAHFVVDRDGTVYRLVPEDVMARHTIGLNRAAIGIENVGGPKLPLTAAQVESNAALIRDLAARHPTLSYLIGHFEYQAFRGSDLWEERDPGYLTGKADPGREFMERLRRELSDLGLRSRP